MIKHDPRRGVFYLIQGTPEERMQLDSKLTRVEGQELWLAPGQTAPISGLGDLVKRVTDFVGIPQCGGCKERQEWLNKKVPF